MLPHPSHRAENALKFRVRYFLSHANINRLTPILVMRASSRSLPEQFEGYNIADKQVAQMLLFCELLQAQVEA